MVVQWVWETDKMKLALSRVLYLKGVPEFLFVPLSGASSVLAGA